MFLSIVIPIYNSEKYLGECLSSIKEQRFNDYEVLLIDDRSTDGSAQICMQFAKDDQRFRYVLREENGGTAAARNTGLSLAQGEYVTFLDNDDWWDSPDAICCVFKKVRESGNPDILCYGSKSYWSGSGTFTETQGELEAEIARLSSFGDRIELLLRHGAFSSAVWTKTIRREFIVTNDIAFPERKRNEDTAFSLDLLRHASSIDYLDKAFYVWRRNSSNSQSARNITIALLSDIYSIVAEHVKAMKDANHGLEPDNLSAMTHFVAYIYVICLSYLHLVRPKSDVENHAVSSMRKELYQDAWLLDYDWNPRVALVRRVSRVVGIRLTSCVLSLVMGYEKRRVRKR